MRPDPRDRADTLGLRRAALGARRGPAPVVALLLAMVTILGGVALGVGWQVAARAANSVVPVADSVVASRTATVLSARRLPSVLSDDVRLGGLRGRLRTFAAGLDEGSCLSVSAEGREVASLRADSALMPASVVKLLTAAVALDVLGPDYRFSTEIRGRVIGGSVVGPLYVVGGGDPVLSSPAYRARERQPTETPTSISEIATMLRAAGATSVTGGVIGVEGRYDAERYSPDLALGIRGTEVGPLGALMLNDGWVLADPIKPADPTLAAAREISAVLGGSGILVAGSPATGTLPSDVPLIGRLESAPLVTLIVDMLSNSDNNTAELLLKEIGLVSNGIGGRVSGASTVVRTLASWGIPTEGLVVVDGSGLERANRASCAVLAALLARDGGFGPIAEALAVAGERGTLRDVLGDTSVAGRLRGKTGTLTGAKSLAGFVRYADDRAATFVLVLNGPLVANQSTFLPLWRGLAEALGSMSDSPSADQIRTAGR